MLLKLLRSGHLETRVYETRSEAGKAAADDIASAILRLLESKDSISIIFAAAPSQNETLSALRTDPRIPWKRIRAYHMDEYIGLADNAPQLFSSFLKNALFDHVPLAETHLIASTAPASDEAERYAALMSADPADIVCMGIGENGHIAFNDPHEADFNDPKTVKEVHLDEICRMQQVHDGCFSSLDSVPKTALTLTIPALAAARYHFCTVPAASKADAVRNTIFGKIGKACPASAMRLWPGSVMYCDRESGIHLLKAGND